MYAVITSMNNMGGLSGALLGGYLTGFFNISHSNFDNLYKMCMISNFAVLVPMILLKWIDFDRALKITD
jgi:hypothetical protein